MAHHDQKIASMLDNTLRVLGGGSAETTTDEGANLAQEWIFIVQSDPQTQWLAEPLSKLIDAINANDIRRTEELMYDLSGMTVDVANTNEEGSDKVSLQNLSTALKDFALSLSR